MIRIERDVSEEFPVKKKKDENMEVLYVAWSSEGVQLDYSNGKGDLGENETRIRWEYSIAKNEGFVH